MRLREREREREHPSDILYKIKLTGKQCYIYLLFEHKSYSDRFSGFQLLRNMVKIWENFLKQKKNAAKLPLILPVIIYQGRQKWSFQSSIGHLFENIENTKEYIPEFRSEVYDISHIPDESIRGAVLLRVLFLTQKYAGTPKIFEKLNEILDLVLALSEERTKTEYLETLLRYLTAVTEVNRKDKLVSEIRKKIENGGLNMPTIAEAWMQEGMQKGKLEGKMEDAAKMISKGMSDEDIVDITGLKLEIVQRLRKENGNASQ